ncbi:MAG: helix-hairpin-helix domain-containing protein [Nitrospirae bacterium]|nr:helix-hairpin-helix domain-containing protein [Nitrospirota bacterium]
MHKGMAIVGGLLLLMGMGEAGNGFPVSAGWAEAAEQQVQKLTGAVNINTADIGQLMVVPGLGEKKSQTIVKYREKNGPFSRVEDVKKVQGIGDKLFEKIRPYLTVKGETTLKSSLDGNPVM